jgi:putative ABC transport system ATP-binding protein
MVQLEGVSEIYRGRRGEVRALDDVSLAVREGEFVAAQGPSGSGKSTLLLTIGGMVHPTKGRVLVDGKDIYAMSGSDRAKFRAENVGFVFQMFHLMPYLAVIENVLLASRGRTRADALAEAEKLLERFGLSSRIRHKPGQLSTGERQRTALARALLNRPKLLLADEPTGNLDPENSAIVMGYFSQFHQQGGTVIVVSHEAIAAEYAQRVIRLREGRIVTPS